MTNPFKFGSVVEDPFFTNRKKEVEFVSKTLDSNNHLIIISPRRFGKTSLIRKVIAETDRKVIYLDVQLNNSVNDFAAQLLKRIYRVWPGEKLRQLVRHFSPLSYQADIGPASTVYSSLKRLMITGCVIKTNNGYELDDPFFKRWIIQRRNM
jgi:AAA+ ATPase superfamily predicted ATPase